MGSDPGNIIKNVKNLYSTGLHLERNSEQKKRHIHSPWHATVTDSTTFNYCMVPLFLDPCNISCGLNSEPASEYVFVTEGRGNRGKRLQRYPHPSGVKALAKQDECLNCPVIPAGRSRSLRGARSSLTGTTSCILLSRQTAMYTPDS